MNPYYLCVKVVAWRLYHQQCFPSRPYIDLSRVNRRIFRSRSWIEWHFNTHSSCKSGVFMTSLWVKSATKLVMNTPDLPLLLVLKSFNVEYLRYCRTILYQQNKKTLREVTARCVYISTELCYWLHPVVKYTRKKRIRNWINHQSYCWKCTLITTDLEC